MFLTILGDLRSKARWCYESDRWPSVVKVVLTDGTPAMIFYRMMQWSHRRRLVPLAMIFNKMNTVCCNCIIGRGAEFGPGFVLIHATGVVINGTVRGGQTSSSNIRSRSVPSGGKAPQSATTCSSVPVPR